MGFSKQALYCYSKAYGLDPTNVDTWDGMILVKEMGQIIPYVQCYPPNLVPKI